MPCPASRAALRIVAFALPISACAPLLDADFDAFDVGLLPTGPVDLPGAPAGDRMIVTRNAFVGVPDGSGDSDRSLFIYRNVIVSAPGNHSEVYFDPVDASGDRPIFFSWRGEIGGLESPGALAPVVAIKVRDLVGPDQPNLFSKLILRFGAGEISVETPGGFPASGIGFGVEGPHTVILRIDPDGGYLVSIAGDGVAPGGLVSHSGALATGATVDPANIGITMTFDDTLDASGSLYEVDDVFVSESGAN